MAQNFLFGVGTVYDYDKQGNRVFTSKTMISNAIAVSATEEEARAGDGNALWGIVRHTSKLELTMQDLMFDMNYMSLKFGTAINVGADVMKTEVVTVGASGAITVTGTPKAFLGGIYGWYGDNKRLIFTGKTGTVEGYQTGDKVSIQYNERDDAAQELIVSKNFVPAESYVIVESYLYNGDPQSVETASKVGKVMVHVPRFLLKADANIDMNATGISNTDLSGQALVSVDEEHPDGYYAKIQKTMYTGKWTDGIVALSIDSIDTIETGDTLVVRAIYGASTIAPKIVPADKLTFTGADATGKVTASSGTKVKVVIKGATGNLAKVSAEFTL